MRYLAFGLDPALVDRTSAVFARQMAYFFGAEVTVIVFCIGESTTVQQGGFTVFKTGGRSKLGAFWYGLRFALASPTPDVVIAQDAGPLGGLAWFVARRFEARFFLQDHSGVFARKAFGWKERLMRPVSAALFCAADRVRAVSERAKGGLLRIGVAASKITVFPIRTDVRAFAAITRQPSEAPMILCVARLESEKAVDVLLKALSLLHEPVALTIVGSGSRQALLEQEARTLKVDRLVTFVGKKTQQEIQAYAAQASIYVQPSHFEGWGMAVIEAAAAGLPIVMTDVGCAGEVLKQEESALIVSPGDAVGLARAIERLIQDAALATQLGRKAKEIVTALPGPQQGVVEMRQWLEIS